MNRAPDVVVVAIDIYDEKIEIFWDSSVFEKDLDIAWVDPCVLGCDFWVYPVSKIRTLGHPERRDTILCLRPQGGFRDG
ncbi:MAG: hypothetical protein ABGX04_07755 [Myxococcales bacterium]